MKTEFSEMDVVRVLNIPRERLRPWKNLGFISPTYPASGQGKRTGFDRVDLYGIALFRELIKSGFTRPAAASYVKAFLNSERNWPTEKRMQIVIFKRKSERLIYIPISQFEKGFQLDLKTGGLIFNNISLMKIGKQIGRQWDDEDWSQIIILNIDKIREKVDAALAGL